MTEEEITTTAEEEPMESVRPKRTGVGASLVGPVGIVLMTAYLILAVIFLLYSLVQFWLPLLPTTESASTSSPVTFLFWTFAISDEVRLILIVAMAGALGSLVHALRSLYWYVGNRELVMSWLVMYILLPFVGATLALVFYFVIRGGFFSSEATIEQTSPFGFAGLGALVGMFSEQAVLKLKEVAETLLSKPHPGEDAVPQEERREEDTDFN
ncbi:MAG TPA: hypothetical protein EYP49_19280 [Anaerolineae bacterium]|nr:hypothetical protein [Anaerolineae bacterium]